MITVSSLKDSEQCRYGVELIVLFDDPRGVDLKSFPKFNRHLLQHALHSEGYWYRLQHCLSNLFACTTVVLLERRSKCFHKALVTVQLPMLLVLTTVRLTWNRHLC